MKLFNQVQFTKPKLNKFDLSHERKLTMTMGNLVPILLQEILPGDKFKVNTEILMRILPLLAPIYARLGIKVDYFFVPNRLVHKNWEKFITGGEDGNDTTVPPYITLHQGLTPFLQTGGLADYMGIPIPGPTAPPITNNLVISAIPFRGYQLIFNEYYRDQNLVPKVEIDTTDGALTPTEEAAVLTLRNRAWEKDYFTSGLPTPQKGPDVLLPNRAAYKRPSIIRDDDDESPIVTANLKSIAGGNLVDDTNNEVFVDNLEGVDIAIEDMRRANRLQEWLEKNMRAGSRYVESLLAHFGVHNDDLRMMRPQYLGGFSNPVVISEVLSNFQFSGDTEGQPQGHMAGHGIAVGNGSGFTGSFKEHGFVFGLMSVLPRTNYEQGVNRHWLRTDKLDYAWPSFAQLGEQPIKDRELYHDWTAANGTGDEDFAFQSRYSDYKYGISTVHGEFRTTLAHWTASRKFTAKPVLNESFIQSDPTKRIFAVQDGSHELLVNLYNNVSALRELPYFNTPTI